MHACNVFFLFLKFFPWIRPCTEDRYVQSSYLSLLQYMYLYMSETKELIEKPLHSLKALNTIVYDKLITRNVNILYVLNQLVFYSKGYVTNGHHAAATVDAETLGTEVWNKNKCVSMHICPSEEDFIQKSG